MYRIILSIIIFLLITQVTDSQVYTNVVEPFSDKIGFNYTFKQIETINVKPPNNLVNDKNREDGALATNINVDFDLIENSTVYEVSDNKEICLTRLKLNNAKSLNFAR